MLPISFGTIATTDLFMLRSSATNPEKTPKMSKNVKKCKDGAIHQLLRRARYTSPPPILPLKREAERLLQTDTCFGVYQLDLFKIAAPHQKQMRLAMTNKGRLLRVALVTVTALLVVLSAYTLSDP